VDSFQKENNIKCQRCELDVLVEQVKMPKKESKKHKFDLAYIENKDEIQRLTTLLENVQKLK
jgi:hypothetical protein